MILPSDKYIHKYGQHYTQMMTRSPDDSPDQDEVAVCFLRGEDVGPETWMLARTSVKISVSQQQSSTRTCTVVGVVAALLDDSTGAIGIMLRMANITHKFTFN